METITDLGEKMPEPGEPLRAQVHEENEKALRAALDERVRRLSGKLSPKVLGKTKKEYRALWGELHRARYNALCQQRQIFYEKYKALGRKFQDAKSKKKRASIRAEGVALGRRGRALNAKIAKLTPKYERWKELGLMLDNHQRSVEYERQEAENQLAFKNEARTWEQQIIAVMRRTPRLHHRGENKRGEPFVNTPQIEQIDFKEDRVFFKIKSTYQTLIDKWRGTWRDALPYGVDVTALMSPETVKNLEAATGRIVTAESSKSGVGIYWVVHRPDSPDGIPAKVNYSQLIDFYPRHEHRNTPFLAGVTTNRKLLYYTLQQNPHLLVAGTTNSGKSTFVNGLISTLITMNTPDELRLVLVDNKGGLELQHFEGAQHNLMPMVREREDVLDCLIKCRKIMQQRFKLLAAVKVQNFIDYNNAVKPDEQLARILIAVDEMSTLAGMGETTKKIQDELRIISSQGRAVGLHLLLCTQNTNVAIIEGPTKTNMSMRISGKMPDLGSSMSILGSAAAAHLPDGVAGRFVFSRGLTEAVVQTAIITKEEIAKAVSIANTYPAPRRNEFQPEVVSMDVESEPAQTIELMSAPPPAPAPKFSHDELLDLIVDKFDLQISPSIIHPHLGKDVISRRRLEDMCKEIAAQDEIDHRGIRYEIKKVRKTHFMKPIPQGNEPIPQETDEGLGMVEDDSEVLAA